MTMTNYLPVIIGILFLIFAWASTRTNVINHSVVGRRLDYIDGLRGVAAIAVVATHFWRTTPSGASVSFLFDGRSSYGPLGVQIFFCITGILFFGQMIEKGGDFKWSEFYSSRVRRIVPAYVSFFVLGLAAVLIYGNVGKASFGSLSNIIDMALMGFAGNGTGKTFAGVYLDLVFGVIWTLRYEVMFYMSFPLVVYIISRVGVRVGFAMMAIACMYELAKTGTTFCAYFVTGGVAYLLYKKYSLGSVSRFVLMLLCVALLIIFVRHDFPAFGWEQYILSSTIFICLAISRPKVLSSAPLRYLGDISYSIYLVHAPILIINGVLWKNILPVGSGGFLTFSLIATSGVLLIFISSSLQYKYVERPWMMKNNLSRSLVPSRSI